MRALLSQEMIQDEHFRLQAFGRFAVSRKRQQQTIEVMLAEYRRRRGEFLVQARRDERIVGGASRLSVASASLPEGYRLLQTA
jgi:hypothetical protein